MSNNCHKKTTNSCTPCSTDCIDILSSNCIYWDGIPFEVIGINTGDNFTSVINTIINNLEGEFFITLTPEGSLLLNGDTDSVVVGTGDEVTIEVPIADETTSGLVSTTDQIWNGCKTTDIFTASNYFANPSCNDFLIKQEVGPSVSNIFAGKNRNRTTTVATTFNCLFGIQESVVTTFTGAGNSIFGYNAAKNITTGGANTIIGYTSGQDLTTGANNLILGAGAGINLTTGSNNILIGASPSTVSVSNTIQIGNATTNTNYTASLGVSDSSLITTLFFNGESLPSSVEQDFTLKIGNSTGTNRPGSNLIIQSGASTGNGNPGEIIFKGYKQGTSSGTSVANSINSYRLITNAITTSSTSSVIIKSIPFSGSAAGYQFSVKFVGYNTVPTVYGAEYSGAIHWNGTSLSLLDFTLNHSNSSSSITGILTAQINSTSLSLVVTPSSANSTDWKIVVELVSTTQ